VAEGVAAEEEAGDLVPVQAVHILAHTALQHLPAHPTVNYRVIQGCGSGSELDPDSIGSVDPDPDPGGQK
jgi:hypothetical protein